MNTQVQQLNGKWKLIIALLLLNVLSVSAQISGNQVYGKNNYNGNNYNQESLPNNSKVSINDNVLSVSVKILLNKKADGFVMTLGLNEEDETVAGCSKKITARITGFIEKMKSLGVKKENVYIDFISQTKIYDFEVNGMNSEQIEKGFEIKKNIIVSTSNVTSLEKIIALASDFEIHDVIKGFYIVYNG